jgi:DNA-binding NarL/FixJ family response regulator
MSIRLVLADDHPIVLDGLRQLFSVDPEFEVIACAANGNEALEAVRRHRPDILVLDLRMPGKDGFSVLRELRRDRLPTQAVVLTALAQEHVTEAIRLGARGVVLKDLPPRLLVQCVREVHAGRKWFEKSSAAHAIDTMLMHDATMEEIAHSLTPREVEVARMVNQGLRNKEIAKKLAIAEGTAKLHLHSIYEKLQLDGRVALVQFLQNKGFN